MKNLQNKKEKILSLIETSNHEEAFDEYLKVSAKYHNQNPGRYFEVYPKLTFDLIHAWVRAKQPKYARKAKETIFGLPYCEAILENFEQAIGDLEEVERLGASVYPSYVPLKDRWRFPRITQPTYNQKKLICWYPGFAVRGIGKEHDFVYAAWVMDGKLCPSHSMFDSWISKGGQIPDYNEKQYIEFAIYEGGPYGTCQVWTDPYWQYLQAKELKKM